VSKSLEIPDPVFDALEQAATASGTTPVGWIAAHLPPSSKPNPQEGFKSLADVMADHIGTIHSGGQEALSQDCGERFTDHLVQKRREGRL